jgi:uncharacterized protein YjlB
MELFRDKNVATYIVFPIVDADGDPVSGASGLDSEMDAWSDGAAPDGFADCTNEATEIGSTGQYYLSLTQAEMNADYIIIQIKTTSTGAKTQTILINTKPNASSAAIKAKTDNLPASPAAVGSAMTVSDKTGFYLAADQAVNATKIGGVAQTGRDLGAGVLVSDKTGFSLSITPPTAAQIRTEMDSNSTKLAYLDASISSRFASASYTAPDNSGISAIKAKTDNLPASPAAVGSAMTVSDKTGFSLAADQAVNCTKWNGHAVLEVVSGSPVVTLGAAQAAYAPAKASDAMTLTAAYDSAKTAASASAVRTEMDANSTRLANLDATISSRLASASYIVPPTVAAIADGVCDEVISSGHAVAGSLARIVYDNLNAPVATVDTVVDSILTQVQDNHTDIGTAINYIDTEVAAIKGKTDLLTFVNGHHLECEVQDKTGFSLAADQAVNATKIGGVTQTGRDLGASVLLSPGTGTGQIALSSGQVTVGTNNDKAGYTASTVSDKTGYSLAADQAVNCTKWNGHAVLEVVSGSPVVTLGAAQAAYAPAKAGDAMTLTYGAPPSAAAIRTEMDSNSAKLANLDASISSRLASASYTAPPAASAIRSEIDSNSTQLSAIKAKTDNLPASPAAVGSAMTLAADQAVNCTKWNGHAVLEVVNGSPVVTLGAVQAAYAPSKAGDAMTLTSGERAAIADAVCDESASGHTGFLASFIDASISSRLASASYTAPDNAGIAAIKAKTDVMPVVWVG